MQLPGKSFMHQFHCGIACSPDDFEFFEDECARGVTSSVRTDFRTPVQLLHGFGLLSISNESPSFLFRLTTALTDYMAFISNSGLQKVYTTAKAGWSALKLKSQKVSQFSITETDAFNTLQSAADNAQRTVPG